MSKGVLVRAAFAAALFAAAPGAMAQPASPPTPTTGILAIGTIQPGADLQQQVRRILPGEMQATAELSTSRARSTSDTRFKAVLVSSSSSMSPIPRWPRRCWRRCRLAANI